MKFYERERREELETMEEKEVAKRGKTEEIGKKEIVYVTQEKQALILFKALPNKNPGKKNK